MDSGRSNAKGLYETIAYSLFSINFACIKIREFRDFGKIAKFNAREIKWER